MGGIVSASNPYADEPGWKRSSNESKGRALSDLYFGTEGDSEQEDFWAKEYEKNRNEKIDDNDKKID